MMTKRWLERPILNQAATLSVLAALVLVHAVFNWRWLAANVTLLGWDVPSHLGTSFICNSLLQPLTLKNLFAAIVWHPNRPPLFFLSAVPLYRLFGLSVDVGTMVNVLYLAVLFPAVYGIGRRMGGRRVGLLAAVVVATLPMIYGISRYFYQELALTAMVALAVYLLLAAEGFERRGMSLLFGLSFGLGLLTRRTYLAFLVAPLMLVVLRSEAWPSLRERLRAGVRLNVRDAVLAVALGVALAAAWYLPNRELGRSLPLGDWLLPLWAALVALTVYLLRRQPGPDTNLLSALFLGGTIGSLWYLPRITFYQRLLSFGFGVQDPRERSANLDDPGTYLYFLVQLINEHLSLITFGFCLLAALGLILALRRKGRLWAALRRSGDAWWVAVAWIVAAYLIFTFSIYRKPRGLTAVLPAVALLLAAGLFKLPWKKAVRLLVVLLIAWGFLQFYAVSFDIPPGLVERTRFALPILGETGLFARGGTLQRPDSGPNDPDYWVVPGILEAVDAGRQAANAESASLGVVVNNEHVNPSILGLWALQSHPGIQIANLAGSDGGESVYSRLFEQDYLLLIKGDTRLVDSSAQEALQHLDEAPELFDAAFEIERKFPLPDGETVLLYRKARRLGAGYDPESYRALAQTIQALASERDAILLVPPEQAEALGHAYGGRLPAYLLPAEQALDSTATAAALAEIVAQHATLWALFHNEQAVDPQRFIEGWLNEHAYRSRAEWYGAVRLVAYGGAPDAAEGEPMQHRVGARLGEQIELAGYSLAEESLAPGQMVRLTLFWQATGSPSEPYTVFAHLLDADGHLIAQQDGEPVGGSRPTTSWTAGETIRDRLGILIPPDTPPGEYRLAVGMYRPDTGQRLVTSGRADAAEDLVYLEDVQIWVSTP